MEKLKGQEVISGGNGYMFLDGEYLAKCTEISAEIEIEREDIHTGLSIDSKITGYKGSGSFTCEHVNSVINKKLIEQVKRGKDPRVTISVRMQDPDTKDGQVEHVTISNAWINKFTLAGFKKGEKNTRPYEFGFTPTESQMEEWIK